MASARWLAWVLTLSVAATVAVLVSASVPALAADPGGTVLGTSSIQPVHDTATPGRAIAFSYNARISASLGTLVVYTDSGGPLVIGLYGDAGGRPGALLTAG